MLCTHKKICNEEQKITRLQEERGGRDRRGLIAVSVCFVAIAPLAPAPLSCPSSLMTSKYAPVRLDGRLEDVIRVSQGGREWGGRGEERKESSDLEGWRAVIIDPSLVPLPSTLSSLLPSSLFPLLLIAGHDGRERDAQSRCVRVGLPCSHGLCACKW